MPHSIFAGMQGDAKTRVKRQAQIGIFAFILNLPFALTAFSMFLETASSSIISWTGLAVHPNLALVYLTVLTIQTGFIWIAIDQGSRLRRRSWWVINVLASLTGTWLSAFIIWLTPEFLFAAWFMLVYFIILLIVNFLGALLSFREPKAKDHEN